MIDQLEMMRALEKYRGDAVVVPVFRSGGPWSTVSDRPVRDAAWAGGRAMGKGSSFALGMALAQPNVKVILMDGDGSLEMNLGSMATIAGKSPENLFHFVMENGVYGTTGGQPIPNAGKISFAGMAREAGYAASYEFDDLENFAIQIEEILKQKGPVFICIKTIPDVRQPGERARMMAQARASGQTARSGREVWEALRDDLTTA